MSSDNAYFVGVDVGTQSVRAALVTPIGEVIDTAETSIDIYHPLPDYYEQSSNNIWQACIKVVKSVTHGVKKEGILGIGFDATCSLVAIGDDMEPVSININGKPENNIILWMDHRAVEEAIKITSLGHPILSYIGGTMSPEMQPPKMMWMKKYLPEQWKKAKYIFDLPDFLTWRATGSFTRSLCSLVCKFLYRPENDNGWTNSFWEQIDLAELTSDYTKIGCVALPPGECCGGLSLKAAEEFGLFPNTPVSSSLIDCYAGALGILACTSSCNKELDNPETKIAMISGTSACHVKCHKSPLKTAGVWGPYYCAAIPNMYCVEAGQSSAGSLIDFVINSHPAATALRDSTSDCHITDILNKEAKLLACALKLPDVAYLTSAFHIYPDFHGNRSPLADAHMTGMISGLTLNSDKDDLVRKYIATVQGLAFSTKHIIDCLKSSGHVIEALVICGGLRKNLFYVQTHADITGLPILLPLERESVLLGSAMLAAAASKFYSSVMHAMSQMCGKSNVIEPTVNNKRYYEKKYKVYHSLIRCQKEIRNIMDQ